MTQWLINIVFGPLFRRLAEMEMRIMGAIEDFAAAVTTKLGTIAAGLDAIDGDITNLQSQIAALTAALGNVTPEQQAMLDGITSTLDTISNRVGDIDTRTPPVS